MTCDRCLQGRHLACRCGCNICAARLKKVERAVPKERKPKAPKERKPRYRGGSKPGFKIGCRFYWTPDATERPCAACGEVKPFECFTTYPNGKPRSKCRECVNAYNRRKRAEARS